MTYNREETSQQIAFRAMFRDEYDNTFWFPVILNEHEKGKESSLTIPKEWEQITPWEQFAGLYDMNGNEIYAGDLFRPHAYRADSKLYIVEFLHGAFFIVPVTNEDESEDYRTTLLGDQYVLGEVEGNIHENKYTILGVF